MTKVFISPSTQDDNAYKGGGNEEKMMRDIAFHAQEKLRRRGYQVLVGGTASARDNALSANRYGADVYVALHSNAGGGVGSEVWYYTGSISGRRLANLLYDKVRYVSSSPDRGVKHTTKFVELNTPRMPTALVEIDFHDRLTNANEIRAKHEVYADAVVAAIVEFKKPGVKPKFQYPTVKFGSSGPTVGVLQHALNKKKRIYDKKLVVDDEFGPATKARVIQFQKRNKLVPDGIVGPKTWAKLV